eukprot:scaffold82114_cov68-Phaeocystis_antarctica.AAC.2
MYRDESETLHEADRSHNFAAAFVRNLRCSTHTLATIRNTPATRLNTTADSSSRRHTAAIELVHMAPLRRHRRARRDRAKEGLLAGPGSRQQGPETRAPAT